MSLRDTQIGKEVWVSDPANNRLTQIGKEVWENTNNTSKIRVSQIGMEVWQTTVVNTVQLDAQYVQTVILTTGSTVQLDAQALETAFHNQGVVQQDTSYLEIIFNYDAPVLPPSQPVVFFGTIWL